MDTAGPGGIAGRGTQFRRMQGTEPLQLQHPPAPWNGALSGPRFSGDRPHVIRRIDRSAGGCRSRAEYSADVRKQRDALHFVRQRAGEGMPHPPGMEPAAGAGIALFHLEAALFAGDVRRADRAGPPGPGCHPASPIQSSMWSHWCWAVLHCFSRL